MRGKSFPKWVHLLVLIGVVNCGAEKYSTGGGNSKDATPKTAKHSKEYYDALLLETFRGLKEQKGGAPIRLTSAANTLAFDPGNLPGLDEIIGLAKLLLDLKAGRPVDITAILDAVSKIFPGQLGGILRTVDQLGDLASIGGLKGLPDLLTVVAISNASVNVQTVQGSNLTGLGDLAELLAVFVGQNAGGLDDLLDLINVGDLDDLLAIIQDLIDGRLPSTTLPGMGNIPGLPNLDDLLGIDCDNPEELIAMLIEHAKVINANYSGDLQDTLLTLLKVAYAQAYQKI